MVTNLPSKPEAVPREAGLTTLLHGAAHLQGYDSPDVKRGCCNCFALRFGVFPSWDLKHNSEPAPSRSRKRPKCPEVFADIDVTPSTSIPPVQRCFPLHLPLRSGNEPAIKPELHSSCSKGRGTGWQNGPLTAERSSISCLRRMLFSSVLAPQD